MFITFLQKNTVFFFSISKVFSRANEQEACGWWRALVKMTKGDFHVVEYLGWETTYTEIVPSDRLRLKNTKYVLKY